jgi:hypothetical protein
MPAASAEREPLGEGARIAGLAGEVAGSRFEAFAGEGAAAAAGASAGTRAERTKTNVVTSNTLRRVDIGLPYRTDGPQSSPSGGAAQIAVGIRTAREAPREKPPALRPFGAPKIRSPIKRCPDSVERMPRRKSRVERVLWPRRVGFRTCPPRLSVATLKYRQMPTGGPEAQRCIAPSAASSSPTARLSA